MSGRLLPFRRRAAATAPVAGPAPSVRPAGDAGPASAPDPSRFRALIGPHIDAAYSLARYLARDAVAAEDIAQEALLKAFRNLDGLRGEPKPWLLAIVRNAHFDWRRAAQGAPLGGPAAEVALAETADTTLESAEAGLIRQGDVAALRAAIDDVPEPFREALVLRELEELSYRQIAEVTGAPIGTVMSRLARARAMLAVRMGVKEAAS